MLQQKLELIELEKIKLTEKIEEMEEKVEKLIIENDTLQIENNNLKEVLNEYITFEKFQLYYDIKALLPVLRTIKDDPEYFKEKPLQTQKMHYFAISWQKHNKDENLFKNVDKEEIQNIVNGILKALSANNID